MPEKGGYPVKFETVKQAVVGMADMQPMEPKTGQEKLFPKLQLDDPRKGGKGTRIELQASDGKVLAAGVLGRVTSQSTDTRIGWQYVRAEGGDRSWLAKARIETWDNVANWLDSAMPTIARERIHIARSLPPGKDAIELRHEKPGDRDFKYPNIPVGRVLIGTTSPNSLGSALGFLSFDNVRPAKDINFAKPEHVSEFETFDGMLIRVTLAPHEGDTWAKFTAVHQADKRYDATLTADEKKSMKTDKAVAAEVKELNSRYGVWAYKLTKFKIKDLKTGLEDITKPEEKKKEKTSN